MGTKLAAPTWGEASSFYQRLSAHATIDADDLAVDIAS